MMQIARAIRSRLVITRMIEVIDSLSRKKKAVLLPDRLQELA
jgi:hypothetical protein